MSTLNSQIDSFKQLIKAGKVDEARKILDEMLGWEMTKEEKGSILVSVTLAYMKLVNETNDGYNQKLKSLIEDIKLINTAEKETINEVQVSQVRAELAK